MHIHLYVGLFVQFETHTSKTDCGVWLDGTCGYLLADISSTNWRCGGTNLSGLPFQSALGGVCIWLVFVSRIVDRICFFLAAANILHSSKFHLPMIIRSSEIETVLIHNRLLGDTLTCGCYCIHQKELESLFA
eukprot:1149375-Prorocentrum_minimum.AAC.3